MTLAWWCEKWHALPNAGGLFDQDYHTMVRMNSVLSVYNTIIHLRNSYGKQIHTLNDGERSIIKYLLDNQLWQM